MKEQFIPKTFTKDSQAKLLLIDGILTEYAREGYDLTLRQLYYQMVARGHIENSQKSYKRMGELVNNARLAGLIDWNMITDRARHTVVNSHWNDPAEIVDAAARQFQVDKWKYQPHHVEVMVEKQALEGILIPVCRELDIRFTANKGYSSSSMMYGIGKRLRHAHLHDSKEIHIFYLGDHDPSGIDMTRDIRERLMMFSDVDVTVERLALNWDQVEMWQPPENPAKETDARYESYVEEYGESSWELDAIEPRTLAALVTDAVVALRDEELWDEAVERENEMKGELLTFVQAYRKNGGKK